MNRDKKRVKNNAIRKLIAIIFCLAVMGLMYWLGNIGISLLYRAVIFIGIAIITIVGLNVIGNSRKLRIVDGRKAISPILYEEGNGEKFIEETKRLSEFAEDPSLFGALQVDLGIAHMFIGEYGRAAEYFGRISSEGMDPINNNVFMTNKLINQFLSGDGVTAVKVMDNNREAFEQLHDPEFDYIKAPILLLDALRQKYLGNREEAEKIITAFKEKFTDKYNQVLIEKVEDYGR
ncbi:hypothetical protein SAMN02910327_01110 [Peptostreptococcaceae bacterium pGA-8]|nr:hypothetical protein SAMN02910327_01110 [Peptostreptococcaceae bacterium pGA-8]